MGEENRRCNVVMTEAEEVEMVTEEGVRVVEWEAGLPDADDVMPLTQLLVPPELATAFSVSPEPRRTSADVNRASHNTISSLRRFAAAPFPSDTADEDTNLAAAANADDEEEEFEDDDNPAAGDGGGNESRKTRREESATTMDDAESGSAGGDGARAVKRPRLVWTPQLHKRFADVVTHLGIKKAVPKTIMQLMNVEGLTRENVASHLQKYRLYLKRQGLPYEGPPTLDNGVAEAPPLPVPVSMQYGPSLLPMPSLPMPTMNHHYHGFQAHPFGSMVSYPHAPRREK